MGYCVEALASVEGWHEACKDVACTAFESSPILFHILDVKGVIFDISPGHRVYALGQQLCMQLLLQLRQGLLRCNPL